MKIGKLLIHKNKSLKSLHTFGCEVSSKFFLELNTLEEIRECAKHIKEIPQPVYFLGGGANSLFIKNFSGTVIHVYNKGAELIEENDKEVFLRVQAGEDWDDFVRFCVHKEYYGLENLTAIPGQVGAAPIQNIGAYGVEVKDYIHEVHYVDLIEGKSCVLGNSDCNFGYRDSIFKQEMRGQFIITGVTFRLLKNGKLKTEYGTIKQELNNQGIVAPTIAQLADTIRKIRASKLPDPKEVGNGGSFFKNPIVTMSRFEELEKQYPEIVAYKNGDKMKIAAGWMIDYLKWKGREHKGAAVHTQQALVLINKNNASGKDIVELSQMIIDDAQKHFGISLETEVQFC